MTQKDLKVIGQMRKQQHQREKWGAMCTEKLSSFDVGKN